ncbi:bifunctional [glutamate--ammonia ligase]-adenylyl-L-tyrosine phosphorylase/[glutamate--ammonia-ligase] adenylyltransferase [Sphingomonas koreensis]|nr:bifunctional [glutamate--ammonia ligase]-adenylyl-L-tyrosine phosphorylase/[glutamate--ammonia-ligase] adenylyltransferase [Sphingomonas koreensis]
MESTSSSSAILDALRRARAESPFLAGLLEREQDLAEILSSGALPPLSAAAAAAADRSVAARLRIERRRLALIVGIGDLAGALDLSAVTRALSDFADRALDTAIRTAIAERTPEAEPCGFAAIALGKLGSRELNYSSDIDPILIFDPDTLPHRPREEPAEAAVRIARRVVELLQARDGDGYVFRVDLRLRPAAEVTPIALSINAALSHYESAALAWERAAFVRARAAAGDAALGARFIEGVRPFVWRRGLDFGAVGELMAMSRLIRDHHAQGQAFGPGYDLKRGRGGIREIEFFAQIHQLIHGGRDPALRAPATRDALAALASAGWIGHEDAVSLAEAYTALRTIEHRAQMVDDRQTHALPQGAQLDALARLGGDGDGAALLDRLRPHVAATARIYDRLEGADDAGLPRDAVRLEERLAAAGYDDTADALRRIERWRSGGYPALRSPAAQAAFEDALPGLIDALGAAPDANAALARLDTILGRLPSAINFFRLIEAQPALAHLLGDILCHAPPLAAALGRRPELFDGLVDASALDPVGNVAALIGEMRRGALHGDYQGVLDHVRRIVGEKRFALGAQIVAGASDPLDVSAGYARVAEAAIALVAEEAVADFARTHGRVSDSELVVLALGRLGGGALTHASDLDLIYLFTGDYAAESDGDKPLGAVLYYNRLAQRLSGALSVPTASGPLYEIDTRLRPSGNQGPLVVSLEGFARYQRESAWTWEHMALTRARPVFGSDDARAAVTAEIAAVLGGARPARDIVADAVAMRAEMAAHKPPHGPVDAKLLPGGLVDLEFAVHVVQLAQRCGFDPDLGRAIDALAAQGLAPASLRPAHDFLTRLLVTLRLLAPDAQPPAPATQALIAAAAGCADWAETVATFEATRQEVAAYWRAVTEGRKDG